MRRAINPSILGSLAVTAVILSAATVLSWLGASIGEALYLSVVLITSLMYLAYQVIPQRKL